VTKIRLGILHNFLRILVKVSAQMNCRNSPNTVFYLTLAYHKNQVVLRKIRVKLGKILNNFDAKLFGEILWHIWCYFIYSSPTVRINCITQNLWRSVQLIIWSSLLGLSKQYKFNCCCSESEEFFCVTFLWQKESSSCNSANKKFLWVTCWRDTYI
jgi:hypothetical protein